MKYYILLQNVASGREHSTTTDKIFRIERFSFAERKTFDTRKKNPCFASDRVSLVNKESKRIATTGPRSRTAQANKGAVKTTLPNRSTIESINKHTAKEETKP